MLQWKWKRERRYEKHWKGQINGPWKLITGEREVSKMAVKISVKGDLREGLGATERKREVKEEINLGIVQSFRF